jgi:hypothetical protein
LEQEQGNHFDYSPTSGTSHPSYYPDTEVLRASFEKEKLMSTSLKTALRIVMLSALVLTVITMHPAKAGAFTCADDCNAAYCACLSGCYVYDGFFPTMDPDCRALCQENSWACLATCP